MVPNRSPPLQGTTGGGEATSLNRGWLIKPSGMVSLSQEENPPMMCLCMLLLSVHAVTYVRFELIRFGSRVPGLRLVTVAVRSVVRRFRIA